MRRIGMVLTVLCVSCIGTGCGLGKALNPVGYAISQTGDALAAQIKSGGLDDWKNQFGATVHNPELETFFKVSTGIRLNGFEGNATAGGSGTGSKLSKDIRDALLKQLEDPNTTPEQRDAILKMLYGSSTGIVVTPRPVPGTPPVPTQQELGAFMAGHNASRIEELEQQMKDSESAAAERFRILMERLPAPK